jgi:type II secretory pathway component PulF
MSAFVTPRQLLRRAELYRQLNQLTAAGLGLPQALEMQAKSPPHHSFRRPLRTIVDQLSQGATFHEAVGSTDGWVEPFDVALLQAGELSGRLPACFQLLAAHYETAAGLLRKTISSLLYPALLLHMAVLIAPLPEFFRTWNFAGYLLRTIGVLVPLYAVVGGLVYVVRGPRGEGWRATVESFLRPVPLLGNARRNLALARLASALEALITAGVSIIESWELAATASGSPALRRTVFGWKPSLLAGVTPAEAARESGVFPDLFCNLYHTGEVTGSLDETLRRLHTFYQEEGSRQLRALAEWMPKLVYLGVALLVGWQVVRFWTGYFDQINKAIQF